MRRALVIATTIVVAMLLALTLGVSAQQPDTHDRTIMTFSAPVELPGMKLEAGTYVFKIADIATRNVIQVFDKDEKMILGQWLFVPAERPDVTGDTVVTFRETAAGTTPAVHFWYYPGEKIGKEFIYPKGQALQIAQRTGSTVLTDEGPVTANSQASAAATTGNPPEAVQASAGPQIAPAQEQGAVAVGTTGNADQNASNTRNADDRASAAGNVRQESTVASNELPKTASPLPLSGLISLLSFGGASIVRKFRL